MGQLGFFDADKRLAAISAKGDPLEMIDRVVPFEGFRAEIDAVVLTPDEDKKSNASREPRRAVGLCGRSVSCERKPRLACRISPTISDGL
jgi:hypothetical protein